MTSIKDRILAMAEPTPFPGEKFCNDVDQVSQTGVDCYVSAHDGYLLGLAQVRPLITALASAVEALEFYADGNSWYRQDHEDGHGYIVSRRPEDHTPKGVGPDRLGGAVARAALADLEKMMEGKNVV